MNSWRKIPFLGVLLATGVAASVAGSCAKRPAEPAPRAALAKHAPSRRSAPEPIVQAPEREGFDATRGRRGQKRNRGGDVPVFVDGEFRAALRFAEIPPSVQPISSKITKSTEARFFRLTDYARGLGIDPKTIRAVHLKANRNKIGSITGDELRADPDRFVFDFMRGDAGMAKTRWETTGLSNVFVVHEIRALAFYVKKSTPPIDSKRSCYLTNEGECAELMPYAGNELPKGTRVYVNGKLIATIKRRLVADKFGQEKTESGDPRLSLFALLEHADVKLEGTESADFLQGDYVVAHATGAAWHGAQERDALKFSVPRGSHGRLSVRLPATMRSVRDGAGDIAPRDATLSAIRIYSGPPAKAPVAAINNNNKPSQSGADG